MSAIQPSIPQPAFSPLSPQPPFLRSQRKGGEKPSPEIGGCSSLQWREVGREQSARKGGGEGCAREQTATAIIVAAGRGERFGASDKVLAPLAARPVLAHSISAVSHAPGVNEIVIVVAPHVRDAVERLVASGEWPSVRQIVDGGSRRQDSVAAGIAAVSPDRALVVIHDAVRPLAPLELFEACLAAAAEQGAAIAAVPVTDTLKRVDAGQIVETVPRDGLWAAQTPQAFRRNLIAEALATPEAQTATYTDEAALLEALGIPVAIVPGTKTNLKITHPEDLAMAAALMQIQAVR